MLQRQSSSFRRCALGYATERCSIAAPWEVRIVTAGMPPESLPSPMPRKPQHEPADKLFRLLKSGLLTRHNAERIARVFYDATKIVYERQKRLKKSQLKMKEVSSALLLAQSIHSPRMLHFEAVGALAGNFGRFDERAALDYYEHNVIGTVADVFGRQIVIDEDGIKSLYKEPGTGGHVIAPENYEEGRGKRLPWIRHILTNAQSVYVSEERIRGKFRRSYLYFAVVSIPLADGSQTTYHLVVVRERRNGELKLVTAYSMFHRNRFLEVIEPTKPYETSGS